MAMNVRLSEDLHDRLRVAADEDDLSMHAAIVIAIEEYLARRQTAIVRGIAREVMARDAELLDRLSR
ncbi:MAG: toxin-antitoxin system HicB family antitoxin [Sporichthyaceae bacterium]|nr:toxin-antitoxin system HicB family antitoxin [Sporichthyaceae bacterium]